VHTLRMPVLELARPARSGGKKPRIQRSINAVELASVIRLMGEIENIEHAFVEQVGARPLFGVRKNRAGVMEQVQLQGAASLFNFGRAYGVPEGILAALGIRVTFVQPREWKKVFRLDADKEKSRKRATELFPQAADQWRFKKDADRAEAALLAEYGRREMLYG